MAPGLGFANGDGTRRAKGLPATGWAFTALAAVRRTASSRGPPVGSGGVGTPVGFDTTRGGGAGGTTAVDRMTGLVTTALARAGMSTDRVLGGFATCGGGTTLGGFTTRGGTTRDGFTTLGGTTRDGFTTLGGGAGRCALDRGGFGAGGIGLRFDACGGLGGGGFGIALGLGAGFGLAPGLGAGLGMAFGLGTALGFGTGLGLAPDLGAGLGMAFGRGAAFGLGTALGFGAGLGLAPDSGLGTDFGLAMGFWAFAGAFLAGDFLAGAFFAGAAFFLGAGLGLGFAAAGRAVVFPCFGAASAS